MRRIIIPTLALSVLLAGPGCKDTSDGKPAATPATPAATAASAPPAAAQPAVAEPVAAAPGAVAAGPAPGAIPAKHLRVDGAAAADQPPTLAAGDTPPVARRGFVADEREDNTVYRVVINHEEQYSIWPADRELPLGWNDAGFSGSKPEALAWIEQVWTDMRPLSLRKKMEAESSP